VLGVPDVGLELVVHRLPDHALQTLDACHADPRGETETTHPDVRTPVRVGQPHPDVGPPPRC
jgi:hypothetical protein